MSDQQPREIRRCLACGKELIDWRKKYCSDECQFGPELVPDEPVRIESAAEPKPVTREPKSPRRRPPNPRPPDLLPNPIGEQADRVMAEAQPAPKPPKRRPPNPRPDRVVAQAQSVDDQPPRGLSKRGRIEGSVTKGTSARILAILDDISDGLTQGQACALHGVNVTTWMRWKNNSERYPQLRDAADARRIKVLKKRKQELAHKKLDWHEPA